MRLFGKINPGRRKKGIVVGKLSLPKLSAFQRLLDLLVENENIKILAPFVKREIFFRLTMTNQGPRLQQIVASGSLSHQIPRAIYRLKNNYTRSFSVNK